MRWCWGNGHQLGAKDKRCQRPALRACCVVQRRFQHMVGKNCRKPHTYAYLGASAWRRIFLRPLLFAPFRGGACYGPGSRASNPGDSTLRRTSSDRLAASVLRMTCAR